MLRREFLQAGAAALSAPLAAHGQAPPPAGPRNIRAGRTIPDEGCCDRPYVVITDDGSWLRVMTSGQGIRGEIRRFRFYNRYLTTLEAVGNFRAGM